ncbi:Ethylene-responsive transcription factor CRF1 [Hordeum vulgare]|nr:Ethylene-responsive transcription factor CRF1 [Hordeum vulgare]
MRTINPTPPPHALPPLPRPLASSHVLCRSFSCLFSRLAAGEIQATAASVRPSGSFFVEIRSGDMHLGIDTFEIAHEATCAYDAVAWRFPRPRRDMNFPDVPTQEWAQELTPPLQLVTEEDHRDNQRPKRRVGIAEIDEEAMTLWHQRFPQGVTNENAFWAKWRATRCAERADMRRRKALAIS